MKFLDIYHDWFLGAMTIQLNYCPVSIAPRNKRKYLHNFFSIPPRKLILWVLIKAPQQDTFNDYPRCLEKQEKYQ